MSEENIAFEMIINTDVDDLPNSRSSNRLSRLIDPNGQTYRIIGLLLLISLGFFPALVNNAPTSLQIQFMHDLSMTTTEYALFSSVHSWCNVFMCLLGGTLLDKVFGLRNGNLLFCVVMFSGQVLFGFAIYYKKVWLMYIGRLLFGAGHDVMVVAQKAFAAEWFNPTERNIVYALLTSSSILGVAVSQIACVALYDFLAHQMSKERTLGATVIVTVLVLLIPTISSIIVWFMDYYKKKTTTSIEVSEEKTHKPKLRDVLRFPFEFWLICLICTLIWDSLFGFVILGKKFIFDKYESSIYTASFELTLFFIITVAFSPIFGFLIRHFGRNLLFVLLASFIVIGCHFILAFTYITPTVVMVGMGLASAVINAALFSVLPNLVNKNQIGSAFGFLHSMINLGMALVTIIAGYLADNYGFFTVELFYYYLSIAGTVSTLVLFFYNSFKGGRLNASKSTNIGSIQ